MVKEIIPIEPSFIRDLQNVYHAEGQLVLALTRMVVAAEAPSLRAGLARHLEQTHHHLRRVELIFRDIHHVPENGDNLAIVALIAEVEDSMTALRFGSALDRVLVEVARKIELHEITTYRTVVGRAKDLGYSSIASMLEWNLMEEELGEYHLRRVQEELHRSQTPPLSYGSNGVNAS